MQAGSGTVGHGVWLAVHSRLLTAHLRARKLLHKIVPGIIKESSLVRALKGAVPFSKVVSSMYTDGVLLAGLVLVVGHYTTAAILEAQGIKLH